MKDWSTIYKLELGEFFAPDNNTIVRRVPGGWVYGDMHGVCFIPYRPKENPRAARSPMKRSE